MAEKYLNISGLQAFYDEVNNRKVNIANISLESQTTTILAQVKNLATATSSKDYARFYTKSDGGSKNISDRPNTATAGAGFVCEAICNRFVSTADYRYQLTCWVKEDTNPYVAVVSAGSTSITWSRLNTNTDTKVRQLRTTSNTAYPVILKWNNTTASGDNTVNFNESFTYNPSTSSLSSKNIKSQYISASSGIYLNNPYDNVRDIKMNGEGISGNDGIDPIETTWVDIINAANSPIHAGVDLKKSGNVISVNTDGSVANSANNDFVIGSSCWVSGYSNFGGGKETKTKGHQNFTFGISSLVYDGSGTMALGQTNSALQENYSLVGGQNSVVETYSGTWSETMNKVTESDKRPSFAFGYGVSAKGGAVVFGNKNFGMGENSAYQGKAYTSKTVVGSSIASIFENNLTAGMSWFSKSPSGGDGGPFVVGSFNWGYNPGTFVAGISSVALPPASFVACKGNIALSYAQSVIGKYNYPEQSLFTIGAGLGDGNRKNVFTILNDGKFFLGRGSTYASPTTDDPQGTRIWVTKYPEIYVGDTLKLYGTLSAAGNISAGGTISAGGAVCANGGLYTSSTITGNYVYSHNLTAENIYASSTMTAANLTATGFSAQNITAKNKIRIKHPNDDVKDIYIDGEGISGNDGIDPIDTTWVDVINTVYGNNNNYLDSNWPGLNTANISGSARSALTSKSALSAGTAGSSKWTSGSDNILRPISFANSNASAAWNGGSVFNSDQVYSKYFLFNPTNNVLQVGNTTTDRSNQGGIYTNYINSLNIEAGKIQGTQVYFSDDKNYVGSEIVQIGGVGVKSTTATYSYKPQLRLDFGTACPQDSTFSSDAPKILFLGGNSTSTYNVSAALAFSYYNTPSRFGSSANMQSIGGGWFDFSLRDGGDAKAGVLADCFSATSGLYSYIKTPHTTITSDEVLVTASNYRIKSNFWNGYAQTHALDFFDWFSQTALYENWTTTNTGSPDGLLRTGKIKTVRFNNSAPQSAKLSVQYTLNLWKGGHTIHFRSYATPGNAKHLVLTDIDKPIKLYKSDTNSVTTINTGTTFTIAYNGTNTSVAGFWSTTAAGIDLSIHVNSVSNFTEYYMFIDKCPTTS